MGVSMGSMALRIRTWYLESCYIHEHSSEMGL